MTASEVETYHLCAISLTSPQPGSVIGLGWQGRPCLQVTPRANSSASMAHRPPRFSAVNMAPLSVNNDAGSPTSVAAASKVATTSAAFVVREAREATSSREWSSMMLRTSTSVPSESDQWVVSACQHSLGSSARRSTWAACAAEAR